MTTPETCFDPDFSWRDEFFQMLFEDDLEMEIQRKAFAYRPKIRVAKKDHRAELPQAATPGSACYDLKVVGGFQLTPGVPTIVPTGLIFEIEPGYCVKIYPRSSMGKKNITMPHSVGVIDSDYRGEIGVLLLNNNKEAITLQSGERIAQMMVEKVLVADITETTEEELTQTERGAGGFGSTGQ